MNNIFKRLKEKINEVNTVKIQKFRPIFTTIDGVTHDGGEYNWVIADRLICSATKYIMIYITRDEYIEDVNYTMYPLQNVVSIDWELVDEKYVPNKFDRYKVFVNDEELEEVLL